MTDPIIEATDRYTEECGKESERLDNCKECCLCLQTIWPEEWCRKIRPWIAFAVTGRRVTLWAHTECLENTEEYIGEEAANE